jgi:hypothetical protein
VNGDTTAALSTAPTCAPTHPVTGATGQVTAKPGTYAIACAGAAASNYTITNVTGVLTVLREAARLLYTGQASMKKGATVKLKAELLSDATPSAPIGGATLTLGFKGGKSCKAKTTAAGVATCSVKAPSKMGAAVIKMTYAGTVDYLPVSATAAAKITS